MTLHGDNFDTEFQKKAVKLDIELDNLKIISNLRSIRGDIAHQHNARTFGIYTYKKLPKKTCSPSGNAIRRTIKLLCGSVYDKYTRHHRPGDYNTCQITTKLKLAPFIPTLLPPILITHSRLPLSSQIKR